MALGGGGEKEVGSLFTFLRLYAIAASLTETSAGLKKWVLISTQLTMRGNKGVGSLLS
jgi:hypothetical protein